MMKNPLLWKSLALFILVLLLMIPLSMVRSVIGERAAYQYQAREDIARSWGGAQQVTGPLLVQSYEVPVTSEVWDKNLEAYVERTEWEPRHQVVFPETLVIDGDAVVEQRYRGIYAVPVYRADIEMQARLDVPQAPVEARKVQNRVVISVSDARGFRQQPVLSWRGESLRLEPGTGTALAGGVSARLADVEPGTYELSAELALGGSTRFGVAPVGGDTAMTFASDWPHPRFSGGYLPESRDIGADGFQAAWRTSHYATTVRDAVSTCVGGGGCDINDEQMILIELADPVNVYLLNDRSVKYGLVFVLIVFGVFLVYELLKPLRIHPVQYAMVGLGQAIFFLLLLSLSEHLTFALAYLAGAAACILLLVFYVSFVLRGWRRGGAFGVLLAAVYGALYVILQSEDYALLLGSVLLFALLALAMYLTRGIDWYALEITARGESGAA